jgi:hypothetical protein
VINLLKIAGGVDDSEGVSLLREGREGAIWDASNLRNKRMNESMNSEQVRLSNASCHDAVPHPSLGETRAGTSSL